MTLPNFVNVGAMKAGTTTFAHMLRAHPDVFMPGSEVHFFNVPRRWAQGSGCYSTYFSGWRGEKAIGEKTPTYSYDKDVPARMAALLPDVKIIWLLREPVSRTNSHYLFFISTGRDRISFQRALDRERLGRTSHFTMNYVDRSVYIKQISRYLEFFSIEQMLFLRKINRKLSSGTYSPIDPVIENELREYFEPDNRELIVVTGLDLSAWASSNQMPRIPTSINGHR